MTDIDPFDEGVPRNGKGQPTIIPLKRGKPDLGAKLVPYLRASTVADAIDDKGGLVTWKVRHAAIGVAVAPDLAAMIAALGRDLNDYTPQDKRDLDTILETAHDRSGGNTKANYGTAVHSLTEDPFGETERERVASAEMHRDVDSYNAALIEAGLEAVESEVFIVNDELKVAGTYDHVYRTTRDIAFGEHTIPAGTLLIGDKKTGSLHLHSHAVQLAVYARGKKYDHVTGERTALNVNPQFGIVARIARGEGKTEMYVVDLHAGWAAAKLAASVREYKSAANIKRISLQLCETVAPTSGVSLGTVTMPVSVTPPGGEPVEIGTVSIPVTADVTYVKPDEPTFADAEAALTRAGLEPTPVKTLAEQIDDTTTVEECHALWRANKQEWTPELSAAVLAKYPVDKAA